MTSSSPLPKAESGDAAQTGAAVNIDTAVLELLASRICHDLISPVGAVNNGVEFLQEMGAEAGGEAIDLIAYSAHQAAAKLQAFRLAYGAGGRDPNIKPEDVHKTFGEMIGKDGRVAQDWDPHGPLGFEETPQGFCKILMGTLMLAVESMPKGGTIRVAPHADGGALVSGEGTDAAPRPNTREALARTLPTQDLDPRLVHAYALSAIARQYGFDILVESGDPGRVAFHIKILSA